MHEFPHNYVVGAAAKSGGNITLSSPGLIDLESAAPAEFGGPGDQWSPETLLVPRGSMVARNAVGRLSRGLLHFDFQGHRESVEAAMELTELRR